MSDTRKYYVYCEDNCKFESMTKEQILTAIQQAVEEGEIHDVDTGFITKILEQNCGNNVKVWVGTEAEFNALQTKADDTIYIYTTDFEENITKEVENIKNGTTVVPNATSAANATKVQNVDFSASTTAQIGDYIIPRIKKTITSIPLHKAGDAIPYNVGKFIQLKLRVATTANTHIILVSDIFNIEDYFINQALSNIVQSAAFCQNWTVKHSTDISPLTYDIGIEVYVTGVIGSPYMQIKQTDSTNTSVELIEIDEIIY